MKRPYPRRIRLAISIIIGLAALYIVYGAALYFFQRSMLFPGTAITVPNNALPPDGGESVTLDAGGCRIEAWFFPALSTGRRMQPGMAVHPLTERQSGITSGDGASPGNPEADGMLDITPTILFAHGNYEVIDVAYETVSRYRELGCNLLLVEYPGYGRTEGAPSEESISSAMVAAYDWLAGSGKCNAEYIYGHGRSVGGGAVCALSRRRTLRGMILQSTFTNIKGFANRYLMPQFLVRDEFDNIGAIRKFGRPVLLIHGRKDNLVPFSHAKTNAAANPGSKLVSFECSHNNCPPMDQWDNYWREIDNYITGRQ